MPSLSAAVVILSASTVEAMNRSYSAPNGLNTSGLNATNRSDMPAGNLDYQRYKARQEIRRLKEGAPTGVRKVEDLVARNAAAVSATHGNFLPAINAHKPVQRAASTSCVNSAGSNSSVTRQGSKSRTTRQQFTYMVGRNSTRIDPMSNPVRKVEKAQGTCRGHDVQDFADVLDILRTPGEQIYWRKHLCQVEKSDQVGRIFKLNTPFGVFDFTRKDLTTYANDFKLVKPTPKVVDISEPCGFFPSLESEKRSQQEIYGRRW